MAKRALGKGLDALFTDAAETAASQEGVQNIPVGEIVSKGEQPRKEFDEARIEELSQSIMENGLIQPIVVRRVEGGYEIVVGERRYRAAKSEGVSRGKTIRYCAYREHTA
jgi:ParB family chromosome partitioning protein